LEGHAPLSWKSKEMSPLRKPRHTLEYSKSYKNRQNLEWIEFDYERTRGRHV